MQTLSPYSAWLTAVAIVIAGHLAFAADAPQFELSPEGGELRFGYVGADGKDQTARVGPLVIDGAAVRGLVPVENRTDAWRTGAVRVELESVSDRAVRGGRWLR